MKLVLTRRSLLLGSAALTAGAVLVPGRLWSQPSSDRRFHALIVAVTLYPNMPPSNNLVGPNNDARHVRDYLLNAAPVPFRPEDVTILADDLAGATAQPTYAAIRGAMADLAARTAAGDFVYLHFSGHGIQQPARTPEDEIDGMDEVFLPRDIEPPPRGSRAWPNGYVDKDIKDDLDAIRNTGAFVWAVFDCCHSGTMTRDVLQAGQPEVARRLDLREIDLPEDYWEGTSRGLEATPRQTMLGPTTGSAGGSNGGSVSGEAGGIVAFYASQTIEPTFELPMPPGGPYPVQMGLFTHTVMNRLASNPNLTYRQLGEAVLQSYTGMNRTRPIPMFEGDVDTTVFGAEGAQFVPEWRVLEGQGEPEIAAGNVHGLAPGARMAILADPGAPLSEALGLVELGDVASMRSTLTALNLLTGEPEPTLPALAPGDIPAGAFARLVEQVVPMVLTVGTPNTVSAPEHAEAVARLLKDLAADTTAPFRLHLVEPGSPADIRFGIHSRAEVAMLMRSQEVPEALDPVLLASAEASTDPELWLMDTAASISLRPGFAPPSRNLASISDDELERWLRLTLTRVYRATNLARLPVGNDFGGSNDVQAELYIRPATPAPGSEGEEIMLASSVPFARPRDEIHLRVINNASRAVDVHALFIGADYSIVSAALPERLQPGNRLDRGLFGISDTSFGRERVVVVLSEVDGLAPVLDLSFLAQMGVRSATSSAGSMGGGLRDLLQDVANAPTPRSAVALGGAAQQAREALLVYSLDVVPAG